jgi:pimeloyl-ACP methyl ester carboxylesterase
MTALAPSGFIRIGASDLEYRMIGPAAGDAPTIVMLHEGLGSVGQWGDFPERLQAATGAGVFVYSRAGYGGSTPVELPRPLDYMHIEALEILPK